jgi:hypothetical protein
MKLSKKKDDIIFIDPKTMQPRCTFNQCVKKFTVEDYEVKTTHNGKEFVSYSMVLCIFIVKLHK